MGVHQQIDSRKVGLRIDDQSPNTKTSNQSANHTQKQIGTDKRSADKAFARTHQLHGFDDHTFGINGQSNGVIDKYYAKIEKAKSKQPEPDW